MASNTVTLTAQQERFAQLIASGKSQAEAYREAYPASRRWPTSALYPKASALMTHGKVMARVEELRRPVVEKVRMTLETHLEELNRLKRLALQDGAHGAAVRAEELRGKASGLYVERTESGKPGEFTNASPDEIEKRIIAKAARLGIVVKFPAARKRT